MEALFNSVDLGSFEDLVDSASQDTVVIERPSYTQNETGGRLIAWETVGTFKCRLIPAQRKMKAEDLQAISEAFQVKTLYFVQLPFDCDVHNDDRLTVNDKQVLKVLQQTDNGAFTIRQLPLCSGIE